MYKFEKQTVAGFNVYKSLPEVESTHKKRFLAGVTPQNQATLNVYVRGSFLFEIGGFSQVLTAGQSTLDLLIAEFPANTLCIEKCLEPNSMRYCVSPVSPGTWCRTRITEAQANDAASVSGLLITTDGDLVLMASGQSFNSQTGVFCWVP